MVTYRNRSGGGGDDSGHAMHGGLGKRARRGTGGRASRLGKERERERERVREILSSRRKSYCKWCKKVNGALLLDRERTKEGNEKG